jgi:hypothetical protein
MSHPRFYSALLVSVLCSAAAWWFVSWLNTPAVIRAYRAHGARYEQYANDIFAGSVSERADGQGYSIPEWMLSDDVSYVRKEGESVVFSFPSLPPDSIPLMIFSPNGIKGLQKVDEGTRVISNLDPVRSHWFFCKRD